MNKVVNQQGKARAVSSHQMSQQLSKQQSVQIIKQQLIEFARTMQDFVDIQTKKSMPYIEAESGLSIAKGHRCPCKVYLISPRALKLKHNGQIQDPALVYSVDFQAQFLAEVLLTRMIPFSSQQVLDCESSLRQLNRLFVQELEFIQTKGSSVLDQYESFIQDLDHHQMFNAGYSDLSNDLSLEMPDELLMIKEDLDSILHGLKDFQENNRSHLLHQLEPITDLIKSEEQDFQSEVGETVIDPLGVYKSRRNYSRHTQSVDVLKQAKPTIELYALKIALCAERIQTSVIGLTNKVLVHELSHWNTHLGLDSDLCIWLGFHDADRLSIEGSAQDLTLRTLERMTSSCFSFKPARRRLAILSLLAFYQLNVNQSKPYRIHRDWLCYAKTTRRQAFQIMRVASAYSQSPIHTYDFLLQSIVDLKSSNSSNFDSIPF